MRIIQIKPISLLIIFVLIVLGLSAQNAAQPFADFYVSTRGNDSWSGKLAEPNAAKTDGPFATVKRAKEAVRLIQKSCYRNIYVLIRGGEYRLAATETFTPADSHYDAYKIVYKAFPGENPVFSSDVEISGWQPAKLVKSLPAIAKGKVFVAPMPAMPQGKQRFYTLFDKGELLTRARSKGFEPTKVMTGGDGGGVDWKGLMKANRNTLSFPGTVLKNWDNLEDIEIFVQPNVRYVTN